MNLDPGSIVSSTFSSDNSLNLDIPFGAHARTMNKY
jgi:hypothetical protein